MPTKYHVKLITTLKSSTSRRLTPYTNRRKLQCTTILDPHFKLDWCSSADQLVSMKQTLKTEVVRIQQPTELQDFPPEQMLTENPYNRGPSVRTNERLVACFY